MKNKQKNMKRPPTIKVVSYKDNEDGSATVIFDTSEEFDAFYLKETGKSKIVEEELSSFILDLLEKSVNNIDDWSINENNNPR